jgi:pimeloyl-ACP methyl ester carboxylesterase
VYLNKFASGSDPLDMTHLDEFEGLLRSAVDLGISHPPHVRYVSRNVVVNHLRLHLLEWGDPAAPPVLLLHGGNQSAHSWDLVSLHLADRFHVFALDLRGHGDSEWARDADYSPAAMADDVRTLLAQERIHQPVIIGHSMGGIVSMSLTAQHPELLHALVLVDIGPKVPPEALERINNFITRNREFDTLDKFVERVAAYNPFRPTQHIERTVRYNLLQRSDGKFIAKSDRTLYESAFRGGWKTRDPGPSPEQVAAFARPMLLVRGEYSQILTPDAAEAWTAALPNASLITVPRCSHSVHTENTPGFLDALRPFLDKVVA